MKKLALPLAAALLAACGSSSSTRLGLSAKAGAAGSALTVTTGLTVDRVRIVIDRVKLDRTSDGVEQEVRGQPFLLDLGGTALDPATPPLQLVTFDAPAGTWDALKLRIHKINPNEVPAADAAQYADLVLGNGAGNTASIRIDGTVLANGQPVPYAYLAFFEEELAFQGPFVVAEDQLGNVTLALDPAAWFVDSGGALLDPNSADQAVRQQIERNIKASLRAFDDDDHDGTDDRLEPGHR